MRNRRHLSDWLDSFMVAFGDTEPPANYIYWAGVGAIAGALQRRVCINEVKFRMFPNHYIVLVGPPATKKSTAIDYAVKRLETIQQVTIGPSTVTWQYFVDILNDLQSTTPEEMARTGEAIKDSTPIVLPASELGTLIDFDDRGAIDFFTHAWDSPDTYTKGTRLMGLQKINGPCPTIIGGTTPQWVKDNVKGTTRGGGFISRCIMPFANRPQRVIAYPSQMISEGFNDLVSALDHDLACIASLAGEYKLTPEAIKYGTAWHQSVSDHNFGQKLKDDNDNWAHRRYTHVHKLAMVIAASRRDELVITEKDLNDATLKIDQVAGDFKKVFALLDIRRETKCIRELEEYVKLQGTCLVNDTIQYFRHKFIKKEILDSMDILVGSGVVLKENRPITLTNGAVVAAQVLQYKGGIDLEA